MGKVYYRNNIFENIDKIVYCAEEQAQYRQEKLALFYYNRQTGIKLINGDYLILFKRIPDNCIDMIFTDLPL